ncbi:hypothetical protein IAT38_005628 [Cryptococcus sp. DSM 104549]
MPPPVFTTPGFGKQKTGESSTSKRKRAAAPASASAFRFSLGGRAGGGSGGDRAGGGEAVRDGRAGDSGKGGDDELTPSKRRAATPSASRFAQVGGLASGRAQQASTATPTRTPSRSLVPPTLPRPASAVEQRNLVTPKPAREAGVHPVTNYSLDRRESAAGGLVSEEKEAREAARKGRINGSARVAALSLTTPSRARPQHNGPSGFPLNSFSFASPAPAASPAHVQPLRIPNFTHSARKEPSTSSTSAPRLRALPQPPLPRPPAEPPRPLHRPSEVTPRREDDAAQAARAKRAKLEEAERKGRVGLGDAGLGLGARVVSGGRGGVDGEVGGDGDRGERGDEERDVGVSPGGKRIGKWGGKGPPPPSLQLASLLSSQKASLHLFYTSLQRTLLPATHALSHTNPQHPAAPHQMPRPHHLKDKAQASPTPLEHIRAAATVRLRPLEVVRGPTHNGVAFWCEVLSGLPQREGYASATVSEDGRGGEDGNGDKVMLVCQPLLGDCPRLGVDLRALEGRLEEVSGEGGGDGSGGWEVGVWAWSEVELPPIPNSHSSAGSGVGLGVTALLATRYVIAQAGDPNGEADQL